MQYLKIIKTFNQYSLENNMQIIKAFELNITLV